MQRYKSITTKSKQNHNFFCFRQNPILLLIIIKRQKEQGKIGVFRVFEVVERCICAIMHHCTSKGLGVWVIC